MSVRIALVQMACALGDVESNVAQMEAVIRDVGPKADLVVFPELATTGSSVGARLPDLAEPIPGPTADRLVRIAASAGVHVVTGIAERHPGGGRPYDASVWIDPRRGVLEVYRKVHLFDAEKAVFTPGDRAAWVDAPWGRTAVTVCYDLCFPEYIRSLALAGAALIVNSTHWYSDAQTAPWGWSGDQVRSLAVVRALENGLFVAMACRAGDEPGLRALGHSTLAGPSGRLQAALGTEPGVALGLADLAQVAQWRDAVSYLGDRRTDLYSLRWNGERSTAGPSPQGPSGV